LFESTIQTNKVIKIDKAFVLRVLFEIYKSEKKMKYDYLKTMLETRSRRIYGIVTKNYLNKFEEFRWFFYTNFDSRTELELIELYSECYNVSNGSIDFDSCYLVMQDTGFLIDDLRLMSLNLKSDVMEKNSLNMSCHTMMKKVMDKEIRLTEKMKQFGDNMGVESISNKFYKLHLILESKH
jgi:hypothetical protein